MHNCILPPLGQLYMHFQFNICYLKTKNLLTLFLIPSRVGRDMLIEPLCARVCVCVCVCRCVCLAVKNFSLVCRETLYIHIHTHTHTHISAFWNWIRQAESSVVAVVVARCCNAFHMILTGMTTPSVIREQQLLPTHLSPSTGRQHSPPCPPRKSRGPPKSEERPRPLPRPRSP